MSRLTKPSMNSAMRPITSCARPSRIRSARFRPTSWGRPTCSNPCGTKTPCAPFSPDEIGEKIDLLFDDAEVFGLWLVTLRALLAAMILAGDSYRPRLGEAEEPFYGARPESRSCATLVAAHSTLVSLR